MFVLQPRHPILVDEVQHDLSPHSFATSALHAGSWVRIAVGRYRGDVGIVAKDTGEDAVTVYVVPRLDLSRPTMTNNVFIDSGFPNRPQAIAFRNPRALAALYTGSVSNYDIEKVTFTVHKFDFFDGMLCLRVARKALQLHPSPPTPTELEPFADSRIPIGPIVREIEIHNLRASLRQHDRIRVIQGSLINIWGYVDSVDGDVVRFRPPDSDELLYATVINDIRREFLTGDHVEARGATVRRGIVAAVGMKWIYYVLEATNDAHSSPIAFCFPYVPDFKTVRPLRTKDPYQQEKKEPRDPLIRKHVVALFRGEWKGYTGYVQSVNDETDIADVALDAQPGRVVKIPRDRLADLDSPNQLSLPMEQRKWGLQSSYLSDGDPTGPGPSTSDNIELSIPDREGTPVSRQGVNESSAFRVPSSAPAMSTSFQWKYPMTCHPTR
ncbi:hypothetical protein BV25DRAFT_1541789 [Artomyces pyxidatus]|uniref:Uncharacterized protein n=1 Tax=Artomyces pyxidatus TaxID=48021 RepID=A0ACB8SKL4_9AGAM|nr:hypothetical protein BV25DRAFT_1541789 [Artomyces pyxidatus]